MFGTTGFLKMVYDALHFVSPYLLNHLLKYMARDDGSLIEGWALAFGTVTYYLLKYIARDDGSLIEGWALAFGTILTRVFVQSL